MIDIHCHILPGIDDGASTLQEALTMARLAADSGTTAIVTTPHFPGEARSMRMLPLILSRFRKLDEAIRREGIPIRLYPGAEILCTPNTPKLAREGKLPTLGSSGYVLTEFYFDESLEFMEGILEQLIRCGYHPIVAHPERYHSVQANPRQLRRWFTRGYLLQLNKGSVLGAFGSRPQNTALELLRQGLIHVVASDAHHADQRTPHMATAAAWLREHLGPEYARVLLQENPARILQGQPIVPA